MPLFISTGKWIRLVNGVVADECVGPDVLVDLAAVRLDQGLVLGVLLLPAPVRVDRSSVRWPRCLLRYVVVRCPGVGAQTSLAQPERRLGRCAQLVAALLRLPASQFAIEPSRRHPRAAWPRHGAAQAACPGRGAELTVPGGAALQALRTHGDAAKPMKATEEEATGQESCRNSRPSHSTAGKAVGLCTLSTK